MILLSVIDNGIEYIVFCGKLRQLGEEIMKKLTMYLAVYI